MTYDQLPSQATIDKTIAAIKARNIDVVFVQTKEDALNEIKKTIPAGADLTTGGSVTLEQIGFIDLLKSKNHPWKNLKDAILAEKEPAKQNALRAQSVHASYFLGSVHAIAETGELVFASATGSQLPAYAFTSEHVIWVAGAHKIVPTVNDAITRIREYNLPLEDKHQKSMGASGSAIGKMLIYEREIMPNRHNKLILVNQVLGF